MITAAAWWSTVATDSYEEKKKEKLKESPPPRWAQSRFLLPFFSVWMRCEFNAQWAVYALLIVSLGLSTQGRATVNYHIKLQRAHGIWVPWSKQNDEKYFQHIPKVYSLAKVPRQLLGSSAPVTRVGTCPLFRTGAKNHHCVQLYDRNYVWYTWIKSNNQSSTAYA